MTQTTATCLWNDSASVQELTYSMEHGAAGATCNPVIVLDVLKKEMHLWKGRIRQLIEEVPTATEGRPRRVGHKQQFVRGMECYKFAQIPAPGEERAQAVIGEGALNEILA